MIWIAVDIGGANIKLADGNGFADTVAFPMWKQSRQLAEVLGIMLAAAPSHDALAVTMTAELADCFATKADGVRFILDSVAQVLPGPSILVYSKEGRFVSVQEAMDEPRWIAASNWHALATYAARFAAAPKAILIDVGSTTTDIVPLENGKPIPRGMDDTARLINGELIYTGVNRTPVCAVERAGPYRGQSCPLAKELFATMQDVYLMLDDLPEDPLNRDTADGRPTTKPMAIARLARCLCADTETFDEHDAMLLGRHLADAQTSEIGAGLGAVLEQAGWDGPESFILSGQGEFVAHRVVSASFPASAVISFNELLGPAASRCAPAHALALLVRETG